MIMILNDDDYLAVKTNSNAYDAIILFYFR